MTLGRPGEIQDKKLETQQRKSLRVQKLMGKINRMEAYKIFLGLLEGLDLWECLKGVVKNSGEDEVGVVRTLKNELETFGKYFEGFKGNHDAKE
jgi:hypothetical protein